MIDFLILGMATGAISLVLTKSEALNFMHDWLEKHIPVLGKMLNCPWCTSHWVALFFVVIYRPRLVYVFAPVDYLVSVMVLVTIASVVARLIYSAYKPLMG
jgi:Protein of unknown function (DUF1360)